MSETSCVGTQIRERDAVEIDNAVDRGENIFGTDKPIRSYFPGQGFREGQGEAVDAIEDAFKRGFKYVVLEAPTGAGKSFISGTFANAAKRTHMLTIQKILQDQYSRDFPDFFVIKGRGAYQCILEEGSSCAKGPCRRSKKISCGADCPYRQARAAALASKVTIHNFDSFYYQNLMGMGFQQRDLLIIDEAHNIEHKYLSFMSFTISSKEDVSGMAIPEYDSLSEYYEFLKIYLQAIEKHLDFLNNLYENDVLPKDKVKEMQDITLLANKIAIFIRKYEKGDCEYVFDYSDKGAYQSLILRPVMVDDVVPGSLFTYGDRVLMMSATILDKELFCEGIGLDPSEVAMLRMDSTFPKENRPIYKKYVGFMSYKHKKKTLPLLITQIEDILRKYPDRKGIIQTHTEEIAQYIKYNADYDVSKRLTFNKDFPDPNSMLEVHKQKPASIIVASGLREGLDLKGSLSQIQIFCKVPYPSLADKQVARRAEISPEWYGYITSHMLVQALGRSIRSNKDKAITFILDSSFGNFLHRYKKYIPDYILEAIV
jgi:ATP-dependent DNA helicase DinG